MGFFDTRYIHHCYFINKVAKSQDRSYMTLNGGYIRNDIAENDGKKDGPPSRRPEPSEQKPVPVEQDGLLFLMFFIELPGL